ncbi:hypothetical protein [Streptomyces antibioticus]|uniref:hypothetical protein n=1 Tax=Streptomyces antibioticus TaxID=1890 RepID=UPI003F4480BB
MADSEPLHSEAFHRARRITQQVLLVVMLGSWIFLALSLATSDKRPAPVELLVTAGLGSLVAAMATLTLVRQQRESPLLVETRARVREAEQDLEAALRSSGTDRGSIQVSDAITVDAPGGQTTATPPSARTDVRLDHQQARLTLSELWAVTHRRLDHYHGIALSQAKQSFLNAQIAMGIGFILLAGFATIAWQASTVAGSVVAGGLGAVSAALAGYVSRTFITSQEAAAGHLRAYFDQPLEFSRYLAAERLMADADLSEEHRAEILSLLVQAMIAGPSLQTPAGTNEQQPGNPV